MNKKSYEEIEDQASILSMEGKDQEAISLLEEACINYPEKLGSINLDIAFLYVKLGDLQSSAKKIKESLGRGICYPKLFFKNHLDSDEFRPLIPIWDSLLEEAAASAKAEKLLSAPKDYDKNKKYPLFIAIHGWGEDIGLFSKFWKSHKMLSNFVIAMPQSSQSIGSFNYCWNDNSLAHKELKEIYEYALQNYNIDVDNIIAGGFSQGATMALDMAFNYDYAPIRGVIALNPSKPEIYTREVIDNIKLKNTRICIITGNMDGDYPEQLEMQADFERADIPFNMSVKENWGHWFPEDLGEKIDNAIDFILK